MNGMDLIIGTFKTSRSPLRGPLGRAQASRKRLPADASVRRRRLGAPERPSGERTHCSLSLINTMRIFIGFYLFTFLIFPILVLFSTSIGTFYDTFWAKATAPIALCTYQLSFSLSFVACLINTFFGFLVAWVLVRYNFPGQKIVDAMIDLPFSLPTSVAGLSLCAIYGSKGWFGAFLIKNGIQVVFSKLGILLAMIFVSFPFVIRSIQPVLIEIDKQLEEAAWCLGATPWQTFSKIVWPTLTPALITGVVLSFSRCIGEYGSIVLLSSNFPFKDLKIGRAHV